MAVPKIALVCRNCRNVSTTLPHINSHFSEPYRLQFLLGTQSHSGGMARRKFVNSRHIMNKSSFGGLRLLSSDQDAVNKVVSDAEKIVGYPTSFLSLRCLLSDELSNVAMQMRKLVGTKHPLLKTARGMLMDGKHNKQMRGLLVMLISKAAGPNPDNNVSTDTETASGIYNSQRSLAEITEVIHTANLIHKGVVNLSEMSPEDGSPDDMAFGNKMAVLSGDYLLASACTNLAALGNPTVVANVASSIGDMMTAEFTLFTNACGQPTIPDSCTGFSDWLRQTFLAFGSLLSKSCEAALMLSGHSRHLQAMAFSFGQNLIYSYQLSQDILPFIEMNELHSLSLTSGPILLYKETASPEEFSRIQTLWEGGASNYSTIVSEITASGVVDVCHARCQEYRDKAIASLECFPESEAKTTLIRMANVMSDTKL